MSNTIRGVPAPLSNPSAPPRDVPQPRARATPAAAGAAPDGFSGASRPGAATTVPSEFLALVGAMQPPLLEATGYEARFAPNERAGHALVEGHGPIALPRGNGRGPSFHAEAGKPLRVSVDPARVSQSAERAELVWRVVPDGAEVVVPLSDGTRDPATGRLVLKPATIDVPADAYGTLRLAIRSYQPGAKASTSWDPSSDAQIAPPEGATLTFGDDWSTRLHGALRAGDHLRIAYDLDRLTAMNGGTPPRNVTAWLSFNGAPAIEVPLGLDGSAGGRPGAAFLPTLRVPFEATEVAIWFRGEGAHGPVWDSNHSRNFELEVQPARDDADPSWKAEMLRSTSFPNLAAEDFVGIGPSAEAYNCIAWTLGIRDQWVWPGTRVEDFDALYGSHGYQPLPTLDLSHDPDLEKIVVYGLRPKSATGEIEVTHGALMDEQGRLTSKIGTQPLIRHQRADDLSGPSYGEPIRVYARPRQAGGAS